MEGRLRGEERGSSKEEIQKREKRKMTHKERGEKEERNRKKIAEEKKWKEGENERRAGRIGRRVE